MAGSISRAQVLARADQWMHPPVPYSQQAWKDGFRTDCSGFVRMTWDHDSDFTTKTILDVTDAIGKEDLQAGDVLNQPLTFDGSGHVVLFHSWVDDAHTRYWAYEQAGGSLRKTTWRTIVYPYGWDQHYWPRRYKHIIDSGSPAPLAANAGPVAVASANISTAAIGQPITFSAEGSHDPDGSIVDYQWGFTDGATAGGSSVDYAFTTSGTQYAHLTVTDNTGAVATATLSVEVAPVGGVDGPVAVIDKPDLNTEVYFTDAAGTLTQVWYTGGKAEWSPRPASLAATGVTDFSVLYKPGATTEVYYVDTSGALRQIWYTPSAAEWGGPYTLVDSGVQSLDVLYKTGGNTEVYYVDAAGAIGAVWYTPAPDNKWSPPTTLLAGADARQIEAIYKLGGNTEVYYIDTAGAIRAIWYTPGPDAQWSPQPYTLPGGDAREIKAIYKHGGNTEVYYIDTAGAIHQIWYTPGPDQWSPRPDTLPGGGPGAHGLSIIWQPDGNTAVYYVDGTGIPKQIWYTPGGDWSGPIDLPGSGADSIGVAWRPGANTAVYCKNAANQIFQSWYTPNFANWAGPIQLA
jgi:hypothetical protein